MPGKGVHGVSRTAALISTPTRQATQMSIHQTERTMDQPFDSADGDLTRDAFASQCAGTDISHHLHFLQWESTPEPPACWANTLATEPPFSPCFSLRQHLAVEPHLPASVFSALGCWWLAVLARADLCLCHREHCLNTVQRGASGSARAPEQPCPQGSVSSASRPSVAWGGEPLGWCVG